MRDGSANGSKGHSFVVTRASEVERRAFPAGSTRAIREGSRRKRDLAAAGAAAESFDPEVTGYR